MNESVRKALEHRLGQVKEAGEQTYHLIKNLENELDSFNKEMEKIIEEKHELEKFLHTPRSKEIVF